MLVVAAESHIEVILNNDYLHLKRLFLSCELYIYNYIVKLPSCLSILVPFPSPSTAVEGGFEESPGAAEQKRPRTGILGGITGLHLASQRV
jgi:hypothetical protein